MDWNKKKQKKKNEQNNSGQKSFINKDVLSVKIITTAKQNTMQVRELLSEFCQQTLLKETAQQRGQEWRHGAFLTQMLPSTCPSPHSSNMIHSSASRGPGGSWPFQQSDNKGWCVCQICSHVLSVWAFVEWGKGEGREDNSTKTGRLKSTITRFLSFTTSNLKLILTRGMKTTL